MNWAINNKSPDVLKLAFELRYRHGYTYLDRCGRTINTIREYFPGWVVPPASQPTAVSGNLFNVDNGFKFSFGPLNASLLGDRPMRDGVIDPEKVESFARAAEDLSAIVVDQLAVAEFPRIGCRVWYVFPAQTADEAHQFVDALRFHRVSPAVAAAFAGQQQSSTFTVVIDGEDRKFRLATEVFERNFEVDLGDQIAVVQPHSLDKGQRESLVRQQREKAKARRHSPHGVILDVDVYIDDPEIIDSEEFVSQFIRTSLELAEKGIRQAFADTKDHEP